MDLSQRDLDLITRTVMSEAGNQPDEGKAAVAHVIFNRVSANNDKLFGRGVHGVIMKPYAFEPWNDPNGENYPAVHRANSKAYKQTQAIVQDIADGYIPDNTGGATHFLEEKTVRGRRGGSLPSWAKPDVQTGKIGAHTFYRPEEPSAELSGTGAINKALGIEAGKPEGPSLAFADKATAASKTDAKGPDFSQWEAKAGGAGGKPDFSQWEKPAEGAAAPTAPAVPGQASRPDPEVTAGARSMTPEESARYEQGQKFGSRIPVPTETMGPEKKVEYEEGLAAGKPKPLGERAWDTAKNIFYGPNFLAEKTGTAALEHSKAGVEAVKAGIWPPEPKPGEEPQSWKPTFATKPSTQTLLSGRQVPATAPYLKDPGRGGNIAGGVLQAGMAPVTGPLQSLIQEPGNKIGPEFGDRLAAALPLVGGSNTLKNAMPRTAALHEINKAFPDAELPGVLQLLNKHPDLAPVDVSKAARERADTIGQDRKFVQGQQKIWDFLSRRGAGKPGELREAVDTLSAMPGGVDRIVQNLHDMPGKIGKTYLEPIMQKAAPIDITGVVGEIDKVVGAADASKLPRSKLQQRLAELRDSMRGERPDRKMMLGDLDEQQGLHKVQSNLAKEARAAERRGEGDYAHDLYAWRNKIVNAIDKAAPGYKDALKQYKVALDAMDEFDTGASIAKSGKMSVEEQATNSPEAWKRWATNPKTDPAHLQARKMGAMAWMREEIEGAASGKRVMAAVDDPAMAGRIKALFGDKAGTEMLDHLNELSIKAQTLRDLRPGSPTFARLRGGEARPPYEPGKAGHAGLITTLAASIPAGLGLTGELMGLVPGGSTMGAAATVSAGVGLAGRKVYQAARAKGSMARYLAEADRLTTPISQQPELLALLRAREAKVSGSNEISRPGLQSLVRLAAP